MAKVLTSHGVHSKHDALAELVANPDETGPYVLTVWVVQWIDGTTRQHLQRAPGYGEPAKAWAVRFARALEAGDEAREVLVRCRAADIYLGSWTSQKADVAAQPAP